MTKTTISKGDNVEVVRENHKRFGQTGIVSDISPTASYARIAFGGILWDLFTLDFNDLVVVEDEDF